MAEAKEDTAKQFDPFASFRQVRDAYLDAMAKTMVETVNSEAYAQTTGAMLDCYLSAAAPVREAMEKSMAQAMQQLSLPSRHDVAALAERFTNLEMRMDDLDAKLDRVLNLLVQVRSTPTTEQAARHERPAGEAS